MTKIIALSQLKTIAKKLIISLTNISSCKLNPVIVYMNNHCYVVEEITSACINGYYWQDYDTEDFSNIQNILFENLDKESILKIKKIIKKQLKY